MKFEEWINLREAPTKYQGPWVPNALTRTGRMMRGIRDAASKARTFFTQGRPEGIDWENMERQKKQATASGTKDDVRVQRDKANQFAGAIYSELMTLIGSVLDIQKANALRNAALRLAIAHTVRGYPIRVVDIMNILKVVHTTPGIHVAVKKEYFSNPLKLLRHIQEIMEGNERFWYDPDSGAIVEPSYKVPQAELRQAIADWEKSDYNSLAKRDTPIPSGIPGPDSVVDAVIELFPEPGARSFAFLQDQLRNQMRALRKKGIPFRQLDDQEEERLFKHSREGAGGKDFYTGN